MKTELEQQDIQAIASEVVEMLKPFLPGNNNQDTTDRILNKKELAQYLGVDVSWINRRVSANEIPYFKAGKYIRFKKSVIDRWIERQTVKPVSTLQMVR